MLVTLVLLNVIVVLTSSVMTSAIVPVVALTTLALATKETAVVAPLLAAVALFAANAEAFRYRLAALSAAVTVIYVAVRLATTDSIGALLQPITGYAMKEVLSRPFAALAMPFHDRVIELWLPAAAMSTIALPLLFTYGASTWHRRPIAARRSLAYCAWILVGVTPLSTMMFVGPDLQGSRYLYLPCVAWSLLLADTFPLRPSGTRPLEMVLAAALLVSFSIVTRVHLEHWTAAGRVRDQVLTDLAVAVPSCRRNSPLTVPAHYRGAYVFRNGLSEALQLNGIDATAGPSGSATVDDCVITPTEDNGLAVSGSLGRHRTDPAVEALGGW
jgi:hypothetical protein